MTPDPPLDRAKLAAQVESRAASGDLRGALFDSARLNRVWPDDAWGWYLSAWLLRRTGNAPGALSAARRAVELEPRDQYRLEQAKCLLALGDAVAARAVALALAGRDLGEPMLHDELGGLLNQLGDQRAALAQYTLAAGLAPREARHHYNRAAVLRYLGDAEGAEAAFDVALGLRPDDYEAMHGRSHLRRQTAERNHVRELESALAGATDPAGRIELCHALAKELEDLGDHRRSFEWLREGAALKRRNMRYDVATDLAIMERIADVYDAQRCGAAPRGGRGTGVIFVFGMPRTGTTLVERVLASHPDVCSAGELSTFSLELTRLTQALPGPPARTRTEFVERTASLDFAELGDSYLRSSRAHHDRRPYFVDKLPFNYLYAGLIRLALPGARLVRLDRHPMDTCYAVFKQLFRDAYPFSYDLADLGRYYIGYSRLMRHWDAVLPGAVLAVRYESLVRDFEAEARRLLDHCGLSWDERCLRFYENDAPSTTASAMQVRSPPYTRSIGRWRDYAGELEPLRARLAAAGLDTE